MLLALSLLSADDLEVISIWSPSYLLVILDYIASNRERLSGLLRMEDVLYGVRRFRFKRLSTKREDVLRQAAICWQALWPNLRFISAWDQAHAEATAAQLSACFPATRFQGKGLLATEAPISIPYTGAAYPVPLWNEVCLELKRDDDGDVLPLHHCEPGDAGELIVSQRSGLLRYSLGDRVEVTDMFRNSQTIRLLGRREDCVDLHGEKLTDAFVRTVFRDVLGGEAAFLVAVRGSSASSYYCLLVDAERGDLEELAQAGEEGLSASYHYRHARRLGQLQALRVRRSRNLYRRYFDHQNCAGRRWGDLKIPFLLPIVFTEKEKREWRESSTDSYTADGCQVQKSGLRIGSA
jgi:hypothetical protein